MKQEQAVIKKSVFNIEGYMGQQDNRMTTISSYMKVFYHHLFLKLNSLISFSSFYIFVKMQSVNIYEYFPVCEDEVMMRFLKKDSQYEDRKAQLYTVLLPTVTETKNKFGTAVLNALFNVNYIVSHRWPTVK